MYIVYFSIISRITELNCVCMTCSNEPVSACQITMIIIIVSVIDHFSFKCLYLITDQSKNLFFLVPYM